MPQEKREGRNLTVGDCVCLSRPQNVVCRKTARIIHFSSCFCRLLIFKLFHGIKSIKQLAKRAVGRLSLGYFKGDIWLCPGVYEHPSAMKRRHAGSRDAVKGLRINNKGIATLGYFVDPVLRRPAPK